MSEEIYFKLNWYFSNTEKIQEKQNKHFDSAHFPTPILQRKKKKRKSSAKEKV